MTLSVSSVTTKVMEVQNIETGSFLRKLAAIVAQIYVTFSQISQNERFEITNLELEYKKHSFQTADMIRSSGRLAFIGACTSLFLFATSFACVNMNDTKFVQLISDKSPEVFKLFEHSRQANSKGFDSVAQLEYARLQDKNNKSASDSNVKEQFAQVLQAEIQRLRTASASN